MPAAPETRYARSADGAYVAYQVWGDGPVDLVTSGSAVMWPIDLLWDEPRVAEVLERLGTFSRTILFDCRAGASSRRSSARTRSNLEVWVDDMAAVTAAVGSERAALLGFSEGGAGALLYAATYPERVSALVLVNSFARYMRAPDYPFGLSPENVERFTEAFEANWGTVAELRFIAPSMIDDPAWSRWFLRSQRLALAPDDAAAGWRMVTATDVHQVLSSIQPPTLVLHRRGDRHALVEHGRYLAEHIPGAAYRELPGDDHALFAGDTDALLDEIEEFLTGTRPAVRTNRVLATILFTDIVSSSEQVSNLGDERWRTTLDAHDAVVRNQLARFRGREVNTTGDGFVATFDGPARALRCAMEMISALRPLGIEIRVGVHTGEVELRGDDIGGVSVHTAARVMSLAQPGELLVSRTVTDLVAGSGIDFEDRGEHELKGIPGSWKLFAVHGGLRPSEGRLGR